MNKDRLYYMDAMRSTLMLLGVVLHSASIYKTSASWAIYDTANSGVFDSLVYLIHLFRMPAFFIVSGFFCHMTLTSYGSPQFLKVRLPRIIVPILTVALTLNTLEMYVLKEFRQEPDFFATVLSTGYWLGGGWVSHLWFLNNLAVYFFVSAVVYSLFGLPLVRLMEKIRANQNFTIGGFYLLILPCVTYGMGLLILKSGFTFPAPLGFLNSYEIAHYASFFFFGLFLGAHRNLIEDFSKLKPWFIPIIIASIYVVITFPHENPNLIEKVILRYVEALLPWTGCILCFSFFKKYFNYRFRIFSYLSDASYTVYLFHHLFVIGFGILILNLEINVFAKFALVLSSSILVSLAIHHFGVLKFTGLRYLFNGKTA